jgi:general secretion pathway protein G
MRPGALQRRGRRENEEDAEHPGNSSISATVVGFNRRRDLCDRGVKDPGFTLIELLVVVTLIVVLAGIGLATYSTSITKSKEAVLKEDLFRMRDAIDQYHADKGNYPGSLDELVSNGYMRKLPDDPFTGSASTWQTTPAELDASNPTAEPGIFDVKSGSEQTALDGSRYADW